jgi:bacillithiol system protein YtxJ
MNWIALESIDQIEQIIERSHQVPCLIFKHSTRCNISAIAKFRLENGWIFAPEAVAPYLLDLLNYRPISNQLAEQFSVYHESPQVLLIVGGECVYDASHLDITIDELQEALHAGTPQ